MSASGEKLGDDVVPEQGGPAPEEKHAADEGYRLVFVMQYAGGSVSTAPTRPGHAVRVLACAHIVLTYLRVMLQAGSA